MEFAAKPVVMMRRLIILAAVIFWVAVVAVVLRFLFPSPSPTRVTVADPSRAETILLNAPSYWARGSVTCFWVRVSGEIDGRAELQVIMPDPEVGSTKPQTLSGPFNFIWKGDWYNPRIEIRYTPTGRVRGQVHLDYQFNWIGNWDKSGLVRSWR